MWEVSGEIRAIPLREDQLSLHSREFDPSDYGNRSILGPPFRIMDGAPTDLWGWIVNIISATGAIVGILGIFVIIFEVMGL